MTHFAFMSPQWAGQIICEGNTQRIRSRPRASFSMALTSVHVMDGAHGGNAQSCLPKYLNIVLKKEATYSAAGNAGKCDTRLNVAF